MNTYRELPEHITTCVSEGKVTRPPQTFSHIPSLSDLATSLVFLLLCGSDLVEPKLNVLRKLKGRTMERPCFLFR